MIFSSLLPALSTTSVVTNGLMSVAMAILNAIIFFILFIFEHITQSIYDYFIQSAFNPQFLFPGIGVGNVSYTNGITPIGFTTAWFYPGVQFAHEGIVNGIWKIQLDILTFVAIPMIFVMIVIQVFAVFFDILEGKLPQWREWFAKMTVAVVFAVLSYWIAGAVLLLGYLPFYAVWTGFTFQQSYVTATAYGHYISWMWSPGAVLLPISISNVFGYLGSGPEGVIQLIFVSVELMVIFLLWFMIVLRNAIVLFLIAVLPIASMLLATNWTANIGKKLWRLFVELAFLPFFVALPLWIFSTLMWKYNAWGVPVGGIPLGAYMANMGFLIFALGMPYLFLEGIGQLQGMGFPSAGQAVSLGTQTGIGLAGVSASIAMGQAKSMALTGANVHSGVMQRFFSNAGGGQAPGFGSPLGSPPMGGGGRSPPPNPPASGVVGHAMNAHMGQGPVSMGLPSIAGIANGPGRYINAPFNLGAGLAGGAIGWLVGKGRIAWNVHQGKKMEELYRTDPIAYSNVVGQNPRKFNQHVFYRTNEANKVHALSAKHQKNMFMDPKVMGLLDSLHFVSPGQIAAEINGQRVAVDIKYDHESKMYPSMGDSVSHFVSKAKPILMARKEDGGLGLSDEAATNEALRYYGMGLDNYLGNGDFESAFTVGGKSQLALDYTDLAEISTVGNRFREYRKAMADNNIHRKMTGEHVNLMRDIEASGFRKKYINRDFSKF